MRGDREAKRRESRELPRGLMFFGGIRSGWCMTNPARFGCFHVSIPMNSAVVVHASILFKVGFRYAAGVLKAMSLTVISTKKMDNMIQFSPL